LRGRSVLQLGFAPDVVWLGGPHDADPASHRWERFL
jgi:hypothetical protein